MLTKITNVSIDRGSVTYNHKIQYSRLTAGKARCFCGAEVKTYNDYIKHIITILEAHIS